MKKEFTPAILIILILFCVMHFVASAHGAEMELQRNEKYYPTMAIITELQWESDTVVLTDLAGRVWEFTGIEDWNLGDFVAMIMDRKGTVIVYDDEIVAVRYCGNVSQLARYMK